MHDYTAATAALPFLRSLARSLFLSLALYLFLFFPSRKLCTTCLRGRDFEVPFVSPCVSVDLSWKGLPAPAAFSARPVPKGRGPHAAEAQARKGGATGVGGGGGGDPTIQIQTVILRGGSSRFMG